MVATQKKLTKKTFFFDLLVDIVIVLLVFFLFSKLLTHLDTEGFFKKFIIGVINWGYVIYFILIVLIIYCGNTLARNKFITPTQYLFPLIVTLSISFGLISLIFGIHTDILTSYDKVGENYDFKWFKPSNVLNFPLNQIRARNEVPTINLGTNTLDDTTSKKLYFILIDKTPSIKTSILSVNNFISEKIKDASLSCIQCEDVNVRTCDLLAPFIMGGIYSRNKNHQNSQNAIALYYYNGLHNKIKKYYTKYDHQTFKVNDLNRGNSTYLKDYFDKVADINQYWNKDSMHTNFIEVFQTLIQSLQTTEIKEYDEINLIIASDFTDSDSTRNMGDLPLELRKNAQISSLKLYHLLGKESTNKSSSNILNQIDSVFKDMSPYRLVDLRNQNSLEELFNEIELSNCLNTTNIDKINFFYPYTDIETDRSAKVNITLKDLNFKANSKFKIKISDLDYPESSGTFIYKLNSNEQGKGYLNHFCPFVLTKSDTLNVSVNNSNSYMNHRLIMEVMSDEFKINERRYIDFLPIMPETSSYYLLLCYAFFMTSIGLLVLYPSLFFALLIYNNHIESHTRNRRFLLFQMLGGVMPIFYMFILLNKNFYLLIGYSIVLILLGLLCLPSFLQCYYERTRKIDKIEKTNESVSIYRYQVIEKFWKNPYEA